jgi:hypothetical protein
MKSYFGVVTGDPAESLGAGSKIEFEQVLVPITHDQRAVRMEDWESLDGVMLGVIFNSATFQELTGSAVMIAPGVALSALHVLTEHADDLRAGKLAMTCCTAVGSQLQYWTVKEVTEVPNSDLAILGLRLNSELQQRFHLSAITTRLPAVSEKLTIIGFRQTDHARQATGTVEFSATVLVSVGEVSAAYPQGRDTGMMPWPCLEIDCPSWGGMSGGPVFDASGRLLGLLSSSFDEGPSYVSLVFPALNTTFRGGWPEPLFKDARTLLSMEQHLCLIDRRDAVTVDVNPEGRRFSRYTPWT